MEEGYGHEITMKSEPTETAESTEITLINMILAKYGNSDEKKAEADELWEWVNKVAEKVRTENPLKLNELGSYATIPQLFILLRECVLSKRWKDGLQVLLRICAEPLWTSETIHHVAMETVRQEGSEEAEELLARLMKQLKLLADLSAKRIAVDYYFYLSQRGLMKEAREAISTLHQRVLRNKLSIVSAGSKQLDTYLHRAYEGLAYYAEWLQAHRSTSTSSKLYELWGDSLHSTHSQQYQEEDIKALAVKAVTHFTGLESQPAVLDTFVSAHVELLEYLGENESALKVLQTYAEKNADNPNAWRYLYEYYQKQGFGRRYALNAAQQMCSLVPSEVSWVLACHGLLSSEENTLAARLDLLMDCLDYADNSDHTQLWRALIEDIEAGGEASVAVIGCCWDTRQHWWPQYHFTVIVPSHSPDGSTADTLTGQLETKNKLKLELWCYKACFAHLAMGRNHSYVRSFRDHFAKTKSDKLPAYKLFRKMKRMSLQQVDQTKDTS